MRILLVSLILIFFTLMAAGCSRGSNPVNPVNPQLKDKPVSIIFDELPVSVSDRFPDGSPAAGSGALGVFMLHLEPSLVDAKLVPLRESMSTDTLEIVDITNFLRLAPCRDCAKIKSVSLNPDGNLVVEIGVKHPFDIGDPLKPITGRNRADLHVFNVEGTVISNDMVVSFPAINESISGFKLLSADGYSPYLDDIIDEIYPTEATLHPYALHFDDYSTGNFNPLYPMGFENVIDPPPSGNLVMAMGCDYDYQDYVFDLEVGAPSDFVFAIGCTYAVSAISKTERFNPEFRIPQHNKKAASEVRVNIVTNDLKANQASSNALIEIEVLDINHGVAVGDSLDQMLSDSSVGSISVEVLSVTSSPIIQTSPAPIGGNGRDPSDPLKFQITINNSANGDEGTYHALVKVLDTYQPGQNMSPLLSARDGIKRVDPLENPLTGLFDIGEFATYTTFEISVAPGFLTDPPVAIISSPCPDSVIHMNSSLFFDGRFSTDDVSVVSYAWDFDWDLVPANFDVDSALNHLNHLFSSTGGFVVGLRVEDDEGQFGYASINVSVDPPITPSWAPGFLVGAQPGRDTTERDYEPARMIVVDCDNIVHCIIKNTTSNSLYYVNFDGSVVSTPENIDSFSGGLVQAVIDINKFTNELHLTYNPGNAIRYRKRSGGIWSASEDIVVPADIPGYSLGYASLAVNYLDDLMVVFHKQDLSYVWFNCYVMNDGSGWTDPVNIGELYVRSSSSSYTRPETTVRADLEGRFHLIYKGWPSSMAVQDYDLFHVIYKDGAWGAINRFNTDSGINIAVSGFAAPDGDVFCTWQTSRFGTFNVMYQRWDASTETWEAPIRVSQNPLSNDYSFIPDLTVDADGRVVYTWEYYDGAIRHVYYKTFNELDSSSTIFNAAEIDVENTAGNMTNPNMYLSNDGKAHLLWEDDRSSPGDYSARDIYYSVFD